MLITGNLATSTRRRQIDRWVARRLGRDWLTGLRSIGSFESTATSALRRGGVLVLFDVDGMKQLNDRWGIPAGEATLRALGDAVLAELPARAFAFRTGGDEATLVFRREDVAAAAAAAERVRERFESARFMTDYMDAPFGQFTLSAGLAPYRGSLGLTSAAVRAAVATAKARGGNCVVAWQERQTQAPE